MVFMVWRWIQLGNDTEKIVLEWWIFIYKCLMLQGTTRRKKEMGDLEEVFIKFEFRGGFETKQTLWRIFARMAQL